MICSKCGKKMDDDGAYCFNCGAMNLGDPRNEIIKEMADDRTYQYKKEDKISWKIDKILENNKTAFIIINVITYLLTALIIEFISDFGGNFKIYRYILVIILYFYVICFELLLKKARLPWYGACIPIYNVYLLFKLAFKNGYYFVPGILPIFGVYINSYFPPVQGLNTLIVNFSLLVVSAISFLILFRIGSNFKRSGFITALFCYVIIPSIAFNKEYKYIFE